MSTGQAAVQSMHWSKPREFSVMLCVVTATVTYKKRRKYATHNAP